MLDLVSSRPLVDLDNNLLCLTVCYSQISPSICLLRSSNSIPNTPKAKVWVRFPSASSNLSSAKTPTWFPTCNKSRIYLKTWATRAIRSKPTQVNSIPSLYLMNKVPKCNNSANNPLIPPKCPATTSTLWTSSTNSVKASPNPLPKWAAPPQILTLNSNLLSEPMASPTNSFNSPNFPIWAKINLLRLTRNYHLLKHSSNNKTKNLL